MAGGHEVGWEPCSSQRDGLETIGIPGDPHFVLIVPYTFLIPFGGNSLWCLCVFDTSSVVTKAWVHGRLVWDVRVALQIASAWLGALPSPLCSFGQSESG